jgi:tetratricopeptide (TPR) repeat protein
MKRSGIVFLALTASTVLMAGTCSRDRVESMEANNSGVEMFRRKMYPQAVRELQRAVAIDGTNEEAHHNLALVHMETENWSGAQQSLQKVISINAEVAIYHYQLGTVLQELTQFSEAKQELERAIQLDPNLYKNYFRLAQVLEELDESQGALTNYTKAVEKNPRFLPAYSSLGSLYADLNFLDQAGQVFQAALQVAPEGTEERADICHRLGTVYQEQNKLEEAVTEFRNALNINPAMHDAMFSLGWTYAQMGNRDSAKLYLEKFIKTAGSRARADYIKAAQDRLLDLAETPQ